MRGFDGVPAQHRMIHNRGDRAVFGVAWRPAAYGLAIALWSLVSAFASPVRSAPLFDVDARIERGSGGEWVAVVTRLVPARVTSDRVYDSLVVSCPTRESRYWRTVLHVGDRLPMRWSVRGGLGVLGLPEEGWARECKCDRSSSPMTAVLEADFLDAAGTSLGRELVSKGASKRKRILTAGVLSGPKAPERVRLRCRWAPRGGTPAARNASVGSLR